MKWLAAKAAAALLIWSAAAQAQTVNAADPTTIANALRDFGYSAVVESDSKGRPKIRSAIDGTNYRIYFYRCVENVCSDIQFSAGFNLRNGTTATAINEWNRTKSLGQAYVNAQGDPFVKHFVVALNDMPRDSFKRVVEKWRAVIVAFKKHIEF